MLIQIEKLVKKAFKKKKDNKGLVPILLAVITTGIFMPTLAIVYDLAQMRLYKTDITNIAQMAVLSCVAHSGNEFNIMSCRNTIRNIISINLFNTVTTGGDENQDTRARAASGNGGDAIHPIPEAAFQKYFARNYGADSLSTTMNNVRINETKDDSGNNKGFVVQMKSVYKPTFLKFGEWGTKGIEIQSEPVFVSASYICQNSKCEELDRIYKEGEARKRQQRQQPPPQSPGQENPDQIQQH